MPKKLRLFGDVRGLFLSSTMPTPHCEGTQAFQQPTNCTLTNQFAEQETSQYCPRKRSSVGRRKRGSGSCSGSRRARGFVAVGRRSHRGSGCRRIDLKDWPSNVPLPSSAAELSWKYYRPSWGASFDASSSTDVGVTNSTLSASGGWASASVTGSEPVGATATTLTSGSEVRNVAICGDRLATWRREESSPGFFFLALILVLLATGLLASDQLRNANVEKTLATTTSTTDQVAAAAAMLRNKSTLLFPSYDLPLTFEPAAAVASGGCADTRWTTYGTARRASDPLRLTVFAIGAVLTLCAWNLF
eukprot:Protomagalhaensia_sp_Gyna_25__3109@NODE_284_length_4045_cov_39_042936_g218_i0_p2_GENE_NODE_284_length_4045_cov_39_042936_g218_i0NODE_284_length_4045_cov_39_042936_g218_i0_p2_ORF_typecomplete_len304_score48_18DUF1072/PF06380_11/8_4e03DUF1072/PF06380_11/0_28_NODE_284_length_4045_cov_39_042936_g218_i019882899